MIVTNHITRRYGELYFFRVQLIIFLNRFSIALSGKSELIEDSD